ncbi:hypothetical protein EVAR_87685_1 [Eumeta japonica]|uniref:Uncharacterized protein n=1 Tax=Eumeta variegata TaxID=151549 RepID=A0A4C1XJW3_EUMVA|nr:hypothetical protein EVAR_87685_1 [Eumeta japonica]
MEINKSAIVRGQHLYEYANRIERGGDVIEEAQTNKRSLYEALFSFLPKSKEIHKRAHLQIPSEGNLSDTTRLHVLLKTKEIMNICGKIHDRFHTA